MPTDGMSPTERFYQELCNKEFTRVFDRIEKRRQMDAKIENARREQPHTCPVCDGTGVDINDESGLKFCPNCHGVDDWWEDKV